MAASSSSTCSSSSAKENGCKNTTEISDAETQLYDRQIRLWGIEAQNRLRNSSVLVVGMGGLGAEVSKNLMLSGLKSLTLMDDQEVSENDFSSQFLIPHSSTIKNRAEASRDRVHVLNPIVQLNIIPESISDKTDDFFLQFDLVILLDQPYAVINQVNKICRRNRIRFQAGSVYGHIGFAFFDFNGYSFLLPKITTHESTLEDDSDDPGPSTKMAKLTNGSVHVVTLDADDAKVKQAVPFLSFEQTINVDLSSKRFMRRRFSIPNSYYVIRSLLRLETGANETLKIESLTNQWKKELAAARQNETTQSITENDLNLFVQPPICPVCAIVGSIIGQEAIKSLSQNDAPLKNIFIYSTVESAGFVCDLSF